MFRSKKSVTEEKKVKAEKLPAPKEVPGLVQKYLISQAKIDADLVPILKAVVRKSANEERVNIRVFDASEAGAKKVPVKDYTSLDEHPDLILYEGWFDERSKHVELEEKKKISSETTLFTEDEIRQKIEGVDIPGSTVFFYLARGPAYGGPLGMGCAIVELNPNYPVKKQKKYIMYTADVVALQPVDKRQKLFDSDKPKEIARWIKEAHHKRRY